METKRCTKCKKIKTVDNFHIGKRYKVGLQGWCRDCKYESAKKHKEENLKKRLASVLKWNKTHPEAERSRWALKNAVKYGRLERPNICSKADGTCAGSIVAHHRSYAEENKLDVMWVCRRHHVLIHQELKK